MSSLKIVLATDSNNPTTGDLYLENGTVRLTANLREEVAQLLWTRFHMFRGEWFLDTAAGVPWFQVILGMKTPVEIVTQTLRAVVANCPGVATVTQFAVTQTNSTRTYQLDFAVTLTDGSTLQSSDFSAFLVP